ncbi:hypothetical protein [Terrabacter sp. NPDC080008]|uniref:hypothetical protein n=1 Tax=Terrabacter sp. NPDC080008 TaxID=3155176 RepID=UPI003450B389
MIDLGWRIEEERELDPEESPRPLLSTWHHLRTALRRRWRTIAAVSCLGLLLGLALVAVKPPGSVATTTLLMAHPADMDATAGSATDVSLLNTRTVSDRTVRALGLDLTPEAFRSTVTAETVTPEILTITVTGPDDADAVARGKELVRQYLSFRAEQLRARSSGVRSEYSPKIAAAQQQVADLTKQFEQLSAQGSQGANQAFDVLARRSDLNTKIAAWQETVDTATLQTGAAIESTHVIDPVHADRSSVKRAAVLAGLTGLLLGVALAGGVVLFRALVSERLRRRQDVGIALGTSVRFSVRSPGPVSRDSGWRRFVPRRTGWSGDDLATLAHGLEQAVESYAATSPDSSPGQLDLDLKTSGEGVAPAAVTNGHAAGFRLHNGLLSPTATIARAARPGRAVALAAMGNPRAGADVVTAAAGALRDRGVSVLLVDLSRQGALAATAEAGGLDVRRPDGIPGLSRGPRGAAEGLSGELPEDPRTVGWDRADVVLALVEVDPGIEVQPLATWVEQVVPLVTAGAVTAELLSTTGTLVREAGLDLPFAMMVGCDATDQSLGIVAVDDAQPVARS